MPIPVNFPVSGSSARYSATVNLDPASVGAATTATQTFTSTVYPRLAKLVAGVPTYCQFKTTPQFADVFITSVACYTKGILSVTFTNVNVGARDLAAADFIIWQR